RRREVLLGEGVLHRHEAHRVVVLRAHGGDDTFLPQNLLMERRLELGERANRLIELLFVLQLLDLFVGVAHRDEQIAGLDGGARLERQAFDAAAGEGGDVADVLRLERARRVDVSRHRSALHGVDPERAALDGRRRGLETAHERRDGDDADDAGAIRDELLGLFGGFALDVQGDFSCDWGRVAWTGFEWRFRLFDYKVA